GFVAGDLIVTHFNPGRPQIISDVIRFNALRIHASGQVKYPDSLVFYSDIDADATNLADRSLPTAQHGNTVPTREILRGGGFRYEPSATQPGFIPGFSVSTSSRAMLTFPCPKHPRFCFSVPVCWGL